jgi:hypothetical protein
MQKSGIGVLKNGTFCYVKMQEWKEGIWVIFV